MFAGAGNDIICGNGGDDVDGGGDNDVIVGDAPDVNPASASGGNDIMLGGDGNDTTFASAGRVIILGQDGDGDLIANGGNDVVVGGDGDDIEFGGPGNDVANGDDGNDVMFGNFGNDTLAGGGGNDYVNGDNAQPPPPGFLNPAINPASNNDACSGDAGGTERAWTATVQALSCCSPARTDRPVLRRDARRGAYPFRRPCRATGRGGSATRTPRPGRAPGRRRRWSPCRLPPAHRWPGAPPDGC